MADFSSPLYMTARETETVLETRFTESARPTMFPCSSPQSAVKFIHSQSDHSIDAISGSSKTDRNGFTSLYLITNQEYNGDAGGAESVDQVFNYPTICRGAVTGIAISKNQGNPVAIVSTADGLLSLVKVIRRGSGYKEIVCVDSWPSARSSLVMGNAFAAVDECQNSIVAVSDAGTIDLVELNGAGFRELGCNSTPSCAAYNDVKFLTAQYRFVAVGNLPKSQIEIWDNKEPLDRPSMFFSSRTSSENASVKVYQNCVAAHPTRHNIVLTGSSDGSLNLWDTRKPDAPFIGARCAHSGNVWGVSFDTYDPSTFVSVGEDGNVFKWSYGGNAPNIDASSMSYEKIFETTDSPANCLDIDEYSRRLCVGFDDGNVVTTQLKP
jgi:WD40 repeat protein